MPSITKKEGQAVTQAGTECRNPRFQQVAAGALSVSWQHFPARRWRCEMRTADALALYNRRKRADKEGKSPRQGEHFTK